MLARRTLQQAYSRVVCFTPRFFIPETNRKLGSRFGTVRPPYFQSSELETINRRPVLFDEKANISRHSFSFFVGLKSLSLSLCPSTLTIPTNRTAKN
jgi:hypothetical protein